MPIFIHFFPFQWKLADFFINTATHINERRRKNVKTGATGSVLSDGWSKVQDNIATEASKLCANTSEYSGSGPFESWMCWNGYLCYYRWSIWVGHLFLVKVDSVLSHFAPDVFVLWRLPAHSEWGRGHRGHVRRGHVLWHCGAAQIIHQNNKTVS